ncbi:hypothetical protein FRC12_013217 [Ceratobasidium sp. 428]|nr:hypothetical protein FRC12_013217 [Ceratobasidium sp. 428]
MQHLNLDNEDFRACKPNFEPQTRAAAPPRLDDPTPYGRDRQILPKGLQLPDPPRTKPYDCKTARVMFLVLAPKPQPLPASLDYPTRTPRQHDGLLPRG